MSTGFPDWSSGVINSSSISASVETLLLEWVRGVPLQNLSLWFEDFYRTFCVDAKFSSSGGETDGLPESNRPISLSKRGAGEHNVITDFPKDPKKRSVHPNQIYEDSTKKAYKPPTNTAQRLLDDLISRQIRKSLTKKANRATITGMRSQSMIMSLSPSRVTRTSQETTRSVRKFLDTNDSPKVSLLKEFPGTW